MAVKTVVLNRDAVKTLFEESKNQHDLLIGLYKMVFPEWNNIEKMNGFPVVNKWTSEELSRLFIQFDREHHPGVINGGLWLDNGFSGFEYNPPLKDWEVIPCDYTLKQI